jgi:mRNA-degrading endonuclease toxin of MazEF toxin-antitoxin module
VRTLSTEGIGRRLGRVSEEELAQVVEGLFELID